MSPPVCDKQQGKTKLRGASAGNTVYCMCVVLMDCCDVLLNPMDGGGVYHINNQPAALLCVMLVIIGTVIIGTRVQRVIVSLHIPRLPLEGLAAVLALILQP